MTTEEKLAIAKDTIEQIAVNYCSDNCDSYEASEWSLKHTKTCLELTRLLEVIE